MKNFKNRKRKEKNYKDRTYFYKKECLRKTNKSCNIKENCSIQEKNKLK